VTESKRKSPNDPKLPPWAQKWNLWIGAAAGLVGLMVTTRTLFPVGSDECGESTFLSRSTYVDLTRAQRPKAWKAPSVSRDTLYTSSMVPKDAGEVIIEQSPRLSQLSRAIQTGKPFASQKLVFVYGAGGAGKSSVLIKLQSGPSVVFINVGEHFKYKEKSQQIHPETTLQQELVIAGQVVGMMPKLNDKTLANGLAGLFGAVDPSLPFSSARTVIVDSLDEVHPSSSVRIIDLAMKYVSENPEKNVVLAGRGEAFRRYFEQERYSRANFEAIHIEPLYVGEEPLLSWYVWQALRHNHVEEKLVGPPPSESAAQSMVDKLTQLWKTKPELRHFMLTLTPANFLMRHIEEKYRHDSLAELLFFRIAERNKERHYRPVSEDRTEWPLYTRALTQIARIAKLEEDGTFVFPVQQTIKIKVGEDCVETNAAQVLNLSEMADLQPFDGEHLRYRFVPLSLQKYLAELPSD